ncbi:phosphotransferase family protein [Amycolatopsis echigonensis]|uniref:Phosphotransferase family protein n=1 Tax=Amycolatopsis echigonensis TaxID=2576905 RepID=A0A8E1W645_9PSEU|nr:phosphotransferase family protein [Amycolatopsis echigonensis]MBB2504880.1 phosphotransferase family protein [Amycolatopsis echigonensis]
MSKQDLPGLDLGRLRTYLDERLPGLVTGDLTGEVVEGGRSNLTYVVGDGVSRWVVRRPPLGHVLPTAHDMAREHRVLTALRGTPVPVPSTIALCEDIEVTGAPFYVMAFVEGRSFRAADELTALGVPRTVHIGNELVDTLGALHAVDPEAVGLADFGRPEGYLERQVRRWKKQLDSSRSRDLEGIDLLHDDLAAALPVSGAPTLVHGDYRLDNVLVDENDRVVAVLDWEMATLGDPLTDVALMIAYAEAGRLGLEVVPDVSAAPGYPCANDVVARYALSSKRDTSALNWYVGFAFFKLAVILEGIFCRYSQGKTVGPGFESVGSSVEPLVRLGNDILKR